MDDSIQLPKTEILSRIAEIENLDLQSVSIDQIKELLNPLFERYSISTLGYHSDLFLYRGIKYSERPENISYLTFPPKHLAKCNRASREGEQIFYASGMREVPFFELDIQNGDKLVLSKWKTTKKLLVNNVGYTKENFEYLKSP